MLSKIPDLINKILKINTSYILVSPYKIYIKGKFVVNLN